MTAIIRAEGLAKHYILSHRKESYYALRDVMAGWAKRGAHLLLHPGALRHKAEPKREEFWALQDVSFDLSAGERLGIIGRNGAGKSTLLKILSRITEPSRGKVTITGRVASLLEVGTGFHPELTGRENIFLNGAILGMSRAEIRKKFDAIVAFAEVEKFLDTPVKRYSSGMYVRLAFAVAAHLEPEILVIDEVLAVGDAQFQKKCLGKMEEAGREGRTILFVSHNMNAVEQLCSRVALLGGGRVIEDSRDIRRVIQDYIFGSGGETAASDWKNSGKDFENAWYRPLRFSITDADGNPGAGTAFRSDADLWVRIEGDVLQQDPALQLGYALFAEDGTLLYWSCHTDREQERWPVLGPGRSVLMSRLPKRLLNEGSYRVELLAALYYKQWLCRPGHDAPAVSLVIQGGLSNSPYWTIKRPGALAPVLDWKKA